ncbi:STAS-like domain-containing protein [Chitinilyticum litopenaei]|uniref:STAS-like domain-containing protein n=1 Tax=Chitinilyticum litopenaei TaxID=1121276 RepID=UPI00041ABE04|nr:STAS-like domain-containing protein [Chitinilyticum litopenaei]
MTDAPSSKTLVPVRPAMIDNESLVSRSQARRLAARFEGFKMVVLDFDQVEEIGQAFADEIFRVFASDHPDVRLHTLNANTAVQRMIGRALT